MLMIYGVAGYTGRLIVEEAKRQGIPLVLGGRGQSVVALAQEMSLPYRRFALDDIQQAATHLQDVVTVLNCAGPFAHTAPLLLAACMASKTHYMDLAGEVPEHRLIAERDTALRQAGIMAMPGVGFGIVPTDCAAALVAAALPDATDLQIAYETRGEASKGTLETVLPALHTMGWERRGGEYRSLAPRTEQLTFLDGKRKVNVVSNPWRADVVGAGYSTKIPNICTYSNFPMAARLLMRIGGSRLGRWLVRQVLQNAKVGPTAAQRAAGGSTIWAEARKGNVRKTVLIRGPEAYDFTARAAIVCAKHSLAGQVSAGYQTPSSAFGASILREIDGVEIVQ